MSCEIIPITDKKGIKRFIKSQWLFYEGNENFVPPIIAEDIKLFDKKKNPLWEHADYQLFIAEMNGQIVGRIAAIENKRHNQIHNDNVGFFGFFECINDSNVAKCLFDACANWLRKRNLDIMRGPTNPTFNDIIGFLVKGFDAPPVTLSPYTPEYYLGLCEGYGFAKAKDLYAYKLANENYRSEKFQRMYEIIKARTKATVRAVNFKDKKQLAKDIESMKELYNIAWQPNWGFVKMTSKEFDYLAAQLVQVGDSRLTLILEIDGQAIGFGLGLPDINQALIHNKNGGLLKAVFYLLTKKKKIDCVRIIVLGVKPEYQKAGLDVLLYQQFGEVAKNMGVKYGDASWILEDNDMMNRGLTYTMNAERYKTFRIYEMAL